MAEPVAARWAPILTGDAAVEARVVVEDIVRAVAAMPDDVHHAPDVVLLLAYAAAIMDAPWLDEAQARWLDLLVGAPHAELRHLGLHGGLAGVGFALAHVVSDGAESMLADIDAIFVDALAAPTPLGGEFDLVAGLVGLGAYFLERQATAPTQSADALATIAARLGASAERRVDGVAWATPAARLAIASRRGAPVGRFDCGLAHGVPGVIALLARLATPPPLLDDACRWMWARAVDDAASTFPYSDDDDDGARSPVPARAAWCYGDPGVAIATWAAAVAQGDDAARRRAHALLDRACGRDAASAVIVDAGLCHGAMGLAHLANRAYQASGDDRLRAHATTWIRRGLALRQPDLPFAGFGSFDATRGAIVANPGLLEGAAGVALTLLAALADEPPGWDRLLLCDLPPLR